MPAFWLFSVVLITTYAFFAEEVFGSFLPFVKTDGGWLIGLLVISIGTILVLVFANVAELLAILMLRRTKITHTEPSQQFQ